MITQDAVLNALRAVKYPGYSRDIVSFGLVRNIVIAEDAVAVELQLTSNKPDAARQIQVEAERVLRSLPGVGAARI
jgi:ATP-binding protein involved in chromosome partitioning